MTELLARRAYPTVPMWDILANGVEIGIATVLPLEPCPKATVRYGLDSDPVEFTAPTLRKVLALVREYIDHCDMEIKREAEAEYYAEVIAPMEAAERAAERNWQRCGYDQEPY